MPKSSYTELELLRLSQRFPSTSNLLKEQWNPEILDQVGYEIWADLSESWIPGVDHGIPKILITLDTIRYLLFLHNPQQTWKSGSFDATRIVGKIWDSEHLRIYEESQQSS